MLVRTTVVYICRMMYNYICNVRSSAQPHQPTILPFAFIIVVRFDSLNKGVQVPWPFTIDKVSFP